MRENATGKNEEKKGTLEVSKHVTKMQSNLKTFKKYNQVQKLIMKVQLSPKIFKKCNKS